MKKNIDAENAVISLIKNQNKVLSITQISKILNLKFSLVYSICKRNNLKTFREKRGGKNIKDISNQKFGSLIVIEKSDYKPESGYTKTAWWKCKCDCGKICIKNGVDLRTGRTKTCGCQISLINKRNWCGYGDIPKSKWGVINQNALQRGQEFLITIEYCDKIWKKQGGKCYLSGLPISFKDNTASLDRIDSSKGYIKNNVAWCHKHINFCKQMYSKDYFIELCKRVCEYNESTKSNR